MALALLSMFGGSLCALARINVKRMLAYSAMTHMSFVLIGLVSWTPKGRTAAESESENSRTCGSTCYHRPERRPGYDPWTLAGHAVESSGPPHPLTEYCRDRLNDH